MATRIKAVLATPTAMARGPQHHMEDMFGTQSPTEERRCTPSECIFQGACRRELTIAAPVPKSGTGEDASGTQLNWATITTSPDQPAMRSQSSRGRSGSSRNPGKARPRVAASPTLWDLLRIHMFLGWVSDKARTGKASRRATQVVPGASL